MSNDVSVKSETQATKKDDKHHGTPTTPKSSPGSWTIETIEWQELGADGTKYALLEGRRDKAGQTFTYAFFLPAGFWDPPHWYTADARISVMQGALHLAYGSSFVPERTQALKAGSILLVPALAAHFDGALEGTVIIGVATGS